MDQEVSPRPIVVMGVCGSGKSTLGQALAERLCLPYADADDFHPAANVAKMSAGTPLDDDDRAPWLESIGTWLADRSSGSVVSCSALRRAYRDALRRNAPKSWFVHLAGGSEVIARRVEGRTDHFMPTSLIESQQQLLEPLTADETGVTVDLELAVDDVLARVTAALQSPSVGAAR